MGKVQATDERISKITTLQLKHLLHTIATRQVNGQHDVSAVPPLFIQGPPGTGKSTIPEKLYTSLGLFTRLFVCTRKEPVDISGFPLVKDGYMTFAPLDFFTKYSDEERGKGGLIIYDDFTAAPPATQVAIHEPLVQRTVDGVPLPKSVYQLLTGNRSTDHSGARTVLQSINQRVTRVELVLDHEEWMSYAQQAGYDPVLVAFHNSTKGEWLHKFDPGSDEPQPSPRTWEKTDYWVTNESDIALQRVLVEGCIGKPATAAFMQFARLRNKLPDIDKLLAGGNDPKFYPADPDLRFAIISALISLASSVKDDPKKATPIWGRILEYGMGFEHDGEWARALGHSLHDMDKHFKILHLTSTWKPFCKKFQGVLARVNQMEEVLNQVAGNS